MSYFVFKLNIQPDILFNYKKNNEFKYLLFNMIPFAFESIMQVDKKNDLFELISDSADEEYFNELFLDLEELTVKLHDLYQQILSRYKNNHDIHYSQDFLKLNEKCMRKRSFIENHYPGIRRAYELIEDDKIDRHASIESESKVGTGITHIRKFHKIKYFLNKYEEDNAINPLILKAYYNPNTEHILVKCQSETAAQNYITALVKLANKSAFFIQKIGKININPIFDSISFEGEYTEINYVIVYPNGNPPLDRYNILKESEAKEIQSTLVGTDGKPLNTEPINKMLESEAKKGYLKYLHAKGKNIYKRFKKVSRIDKTS